MWALSMGQTWGLLGPIQVDSSEEQRIQQDAAGGLTKFLEAGEGVGHQAAWRALVRVRAKKVANEDSSGGPPGQPDSFRDIIKVRSICQQWALQLGGGDPGGRWNQVRVFVKCCPRLEKVESNSWASMENPEDQPHSITTKPFCQKH